MSILRIFHIIFLLGSIGSHILWYYFLTQVLVLKEYFPQFFSETSGLLAGLGAGGWIISTGYLIFYTQSCKKHENPVNRDPSKFTTALHVLRNYNHYKDKAISNSKQLCLYPTECILLCGSGVVMLFLFVVILIIKSFY